MGRTGPAAPELALMRLPLMSERLLPLASGADKIGAGEAGPAPHGTADELVGGRPEPPLLGEGRTTAAPPLPEGPTTDSVVDEELAIGGAAIDEGIAGGSVLLIGTAPPARPVTVAMAVAYAGGVPC